MIQAAADGRLAKREDKREQPSLIHVIEGMKGEIARALPKHLSPDRMARIAITALRTTPDLAKTTPASFLSSLMACSVLGLEPNTPLGHAYLIPYNNSRRINNEWVKVPECQLIIGYQGFIDLVRRSGQVASVQAFAVYEGDLFEYELGLCPRISHKPCDDAERENRKLTYAYCVIKLKDKEADPIFFVMSRAQIEKRRMRGASGRTDRNGKQVRTPWDTDYEAMALKTVVRSAVKWAPRSAEVAQAVELDERAERGGNQLSALPAEVSQALLEGGHVDDADFVETDATEEQVANG